MKIIKVFLVVLTVQLSINAGAVSMRNTERLVNARKISTMPKKVHDGIVVKSTDNLHFAYVTGSEAGMYVMRDFDQDMSYKFIKPDSLVFSPDGRHLAYVAGDSIEDLFVVLDGRRKSSRSMQEVICLVFSPDSKKIAYAGKVFDKWQVTFADSVGVQFDDIRPGSLSFGPDSRHISYIAKDFNKWYVVIDDSKGSEYSYIPDWTNLVWLSPDTVSFLLLDVSYDVYMIKETLRKK